MKAKKKYGKGGNYEMYEKGGIIPKKKKGKKPDYRKTETFQDYKSAAATFADYNPQSDTVFVGTSIDPAIADKKAQRKANVSASKGASKANYNDTKMYRTKNEAGQDVYVSLRKYDKKEYSKGGSVKIKKKKLSPAEREAETTKMANVAKERLAEMEGEKAYLKKRSEADRQYKQAIKEGATPEQATKIAEKYLKNGGKMSMYKKGGMVRAKKSC